MEKINNNLDDLIIPQKMEQKDITLTDILRQLWDKRKLIIYIIAVFLLIGIFTALFSPTRYTATCTVIPQNTSTSSMGNLGSLASMAGINLGSSGAVTGGVLSPNTYQTIMSSLPFTEEIMKTLIIVDKSNEKEITLFEYYTNKKYAEVNVLATIRKYTLGLPRIIKSLVSRTNKNKDIPITPVNLKRDTASLIVPSHILNVSDIIKGSILYKLDKDKGVITLGYIFPEALASAQITESIRKTLEKYVIDYKTKKVEANMTFVEESYMEARRDFLQKQAILAAFQDANRDLITEKARATEKKLSSEYDIAFTIYNELARQREQAKLTVKETQPILIVVDPVKVPLQKSAPNKGRTIFIFIVLGLIVSCLWVLLAPPLKEIIDETKEQKI